MLMLTFLEKSRALSDWSLVSGVLFFGDSVDEWECSFDGAQIEVRIEFGVIQQLFDSCIVFFDNGSKK